MPHSRTNVFSSIRSCVMRSTADVRIDQPPVGLEREHRFERDVLELVGDDVAARAEFADRAQIVVRGDELFVGDLSGRRVGERLERDDAIAHALRFEREHAAELAAAEDADRADHSGRCFDLGGDARGAFVESLRRAP